jgi:formamidopyrimidine-DNA glycosylase
VPELPDLLYVRSYLTSALKGRSVTSVLVKRPVVLRSISGEPIESLVARSRIDEVLVRGPFLQLQFSSGNDLIINLMLAGRLQHQHAGEKPVGFLCLALEFNDATRLNLCDEQLMAKVYLTSRGRYAWIPRFTQQGLDVLSRAFTREAFQERARMHPRRQIRALLNDQTILSAIGNAYADEILFESRIHPKTLVSHLNQETLGHLHDAIVSVLDWGRHEVECAAQPIHVKVRDHLRVRNRKGQPCVRCGTTIRREGVRGHDTFFCPTCQPATRRLFLEWPSVKGNPGT